MSYTGVKKTLVLKLNKTPVAKKWHPSKSNSHNINLYHFI